MFKKILSLITIILILLLAREFLKEDHNQFPEYKVTRVIDGDTLEIKFEDGIKKLRLIGIDAPESVHPDKDKNTEFGKIASEFTKQRLENKKVGVEYDAQLFDRYGRVLAYIYLDGEMYNEIMLREGMATIMTISPNVKYVDRFFESQEEAKANKK
ncbi:MAG: thermonuclease family protein [Tissierellia bacterium]|nr:thermonuclease family protein [Tissierellia bacterium]